VWLSCDLYLESLTQICLFVIQLLSVIMMTWVLFMLKHPLNPVLAFWVIFLRFSGINQDCIYFYKRQENRQVWSFSLFAAPVSGNRPVPGSAVLNDCGRSVCAQIAYLLVFLDRGWPNQIIPHFTSHCHWPRLAAQRIQNYGCLW